MEIEEKLKQERKKILSTFFDQWLEGEKAKCDKISDEIAELKEQRDNRILELARDDYPDKEINSIEDVDMLLLRDSGHSGFYKEAREKYRHYKSVSTLNEQIDAKQNELDSRRRDINEAKAFDNGVEFLSKVAEIEQLEGEISNLQKRLESVKKEADHQKTWYIEKKTSYEKLLKEFEESHKEVAA